MPLAILHASEEEDLDDAVQRALSPTVDLVITRTKAAAYLDVNEGAIYQLVNKGVLTPCEDSLGQIPLFPMKSLVQERERRKKTKF